jgi:hypothetical protein
MYQIAAINHRQEQIINWLIANPHRQLGDCAAYFGYSQPWLSIIVHSDLFQAAYKERCKELGAEVVHTVRNKLTGLAALSLDKTMEKLEAGASERFLGETTKNVLQALGYAPAGGNGNGGEQKHLHIHVDGATLTAARERAALQREGGNGRELSESPQAIGIPSLPPAILDLCMEEPKAQDTAEPMGTVAP